MASGKTHDRITLLMAVPVFGISHWGVGLGVFESSVVMTGCLLGGLLLSPDLDTRSRPFYRWGPFRFIWRPYQWMIRHRSAQSHGIFLAPLFRLLYLTAVLVLFYLALALLIEVRAADAFERWRANIRMFLDEHWQNWLLLAVGVWWGGLFHWIMDGLPSGRRGR